MDKIKVLKAKAVCALSLALLAFSACKKINFTEDSILNTTDTIDWVIRWGWNDFPVGPSGDLVRMCADNPGYRSVTLIPDSTSISVALSRYFCAERWERIADSFYVYQAYNQNKVQFAGNLYVNSKGGCHLSNDTTTTSQSILGMCDREYLRFRKLGLNVFEAPEH